MASRERADVDTFHKCIQYSLEKLGKSKSGFERTVVSKFKSKRRVGSGNDLVDYSRAPIRVLVLTKRHVGSGNEIGSEAAHVQAEAQGARHSGKMTAHAPLFSRVRS